MQQKIVLKCLYCDESFKTKSDLMSHRKMIHRTKLSVCREYKSGNCKFMPNNCWYSHNEGFQSENSKEDSKEPVFWKSRVNSQPPDLIERIMSMLEVVTSKVKELEVTVKKNQ